MVVGREEFKPVLTSVRYASLHFGLNLFAQSWAELQLLVSVIGEWKSRIRFLLNWCYDVYWKMAGILVNPCYWYEAIWIATVKQKELIGIYILYMAQIKTPGNLKYNPTSYVTPHRENDSEALFNQRCDSILKEWFRTHTSFSLNVNGISKSFHNMDNFFFLHYLSQAL